jgi:hypothetical protein
MELLETLLLTTMATDSQPGIKTMMHIAEYTVPNDRKVLGGTIDAATQILMVIITTQYPIEHMMRTE